MEVMDEVGKLDRNGQSKAKIQCKWVWFKLAVGTCGIKLSRDWESIKGNSTYSIQSSKHQSMGKQLFQFPVADSWTVGAPYLSTLGWTEFSRFFYMN